MKDETGPAKNELDVLKYFIWLMLVMTLALGVVYWIVRNELQATRANVQSGDAARKEFAQIESEIQSMLNVYRTNKEDIARDSPGVWFSNTWRRRGIPDTSMSPGSWKSDFNVRGKFYEERIEMAFNPKAPLSRQSIAEFCHEIEKSSTRLRVMELDIRRTNKDDFDKDEWAGKATIGYRHARND